MSSDINVQTFSGKVNINNNLLVGSSHFFVDTVNNRVGITTADPQASLDVNGDVNVGTNLTLGGILTGDGSGLTNVNSDSGLWAGAGTGSVYLSTSTDNVGIGTTSPDARLHLEEPSVISATTRLFHTENAFAGGSRGHFEIIEKKTGAGTGWSDFTLRLQRRVDVTEQGYIEFNPSGSTGDYGIAFGNSGGGGPGEIMRIVGQSGNVGIGKTDPGTALDVLGTIRVQTGTNDATGGEFSIDTNVGHIRRKVGGNGVSLTSYDDFQFYVNATGGSAEGGTQAMIIDNSGNVGIGTTDPKTRLHVSHDLHLQSSSESWNTTAGKGLYLRYSTSGGQDAAYIQSIDRTNASLSYPMIFQGSSYEFSVGSMGIGKTPSEKLHVHENLSTSGHQIMTRIGGDTSSYNTLVFGSKEGRPHIGGHRGDFGAWADLSLQNDLMILQQSTDRVGIGTSGPSGKLHIYESTGTSHGVNVGTLILDHGNSGGSSSIVFPSRVNNTSDYAYITYNENYGEAGVSSSENGVLLLGAENDGTGSSDHVRVKTRLVVEADMTSSDPTYAFQVKSSNTTSDLFAVHRDGSIGINGIDLAVPLTINSNKTAVLGGSTRYTTYCRWYRGFGNWWIGSDNNTTWNHNLYWFANVNLTGNPLRKVITFENDQEKGTVVNVNTFTGQHRNIVKGVNPTSIESFIGLIVSADNNENIKVNGGVERGLEAITINETIPLVSVTTKAYDKQVFGVVSGSEDPDSRQDTYGRVTCSFLKEEGDDRIFINSLGEGAMWISNQNGPLESGDYVTSSHIPGYGMKQDSEFLANYTVAKITMDCDFQVTPRVKYRIKTELKTVNYFRHEESFLKESDYNKLEPDTQSDYTLEQYDENVNILDEYGQLQWEDSGETEAPYRVRYLLPNGTQISEEEYTTRALSNEEVYIAAFVGCTYHCG
jgi:hypothetical protein